MEILLDETVHRLPDFLVIGGARCGTSSLYSHLYEHPEIFMPDLKEPHFFNYLGCSASPHPNRPPWTIADYTALFSYARPEQKLGEASASYLTFQDKVIPTMRSIYGDRIREVRIVMVLRNPIDRAWSYHMLLRRSGHEMSFFEMVNKYCGGKDNTFHDFLSAGHYPDKVRGYLKAFDSVRIFMFEDLKRDPVTVVGSIFKLIGVNDTGFVPGNIHATYNASGSPRSDLSRFIYYFLFRDNNMKRIIKHTLPVRWRLRIKAEVGAKIMKKVEMPADVREFLNTTYSKSMESLRDLLPDPTQKAVVDEWRM
jgi:hypothetical protein